MSAAPDSVPRMDVLLIPGLWLDASSWEDVLPSLRAEGLRARPLTMPGVGRPGAESADVGISDWVDSVVAEIDRADRARTATEAPRRRDGIAVEVVDDRDRHRGHAPEREARPRRDDAEANAEIDQRLAACVFVDELPQTCDGPAAAHITMIVERARDGLERLLERAAIAAAADRDRAGPRLDVRDVQEQVPVGDAGLNVQAELHGAAPLAR